MATVCGASLALMDAGVPLERPVAGIAMGLIKEGKDYAILSDIIGDEDHLGDMDFKVAGTQNGITALQMDLKITSITRNIMEVALEQARVGRLHILGKMEEAIGGAREEVREYAPRMITFTIAKEKIREVIGTGGKVIREICEKTGAKIDITDDGTINVSGANAEVIGAAEKWIRGITDEPEVGHIYKGKVVRIVDFGAFVSFFGSQDGLVHVSELAPRRVEKVSDVVKEGDEVFVKVMESDTRGKIRLSMKRVDQNTGHEILADASNASAES
jgi:polyribonucleotide nucleotidyltransferase